MQGSKTKSGGQAEAKSNGKSEAKGTPPTPKSAKTPRKPAVPKAPPRPAADKSPGSADRKTPKSASRITTPPEKQGKDAKPAQEPAAAKPSSQEAAAAVKPSTQEQQAQLAAVQEELVKAKEQLVEKEKERGKVLDELECAKRAADEANAKLQEALAARSKAAEDSATDNSGAGAVESEPASVGSPQSMEDELRTKLASMQSQQEADMAVLHSTVEQLEKARYELADAIDAKNAALNQVDDAMKTSEGNAEKIKLLNAEVTHLKGLLDSEIGGTSKGAVERIRKLEEENSGLRLELEKANVAEQRAVELEGVVEQLKVEVADVKKARARSEELLGKWKTKALELEVRLEEADQSNILKGESLESAMKELDAKITLLLEKESEIDALQDNIRSLEDVVAKQKGNIDSAEKEAVELRSEIEDLRLKLQAAEDDLNNDRITSSEVETLTEQKNNLTKELENCKAEVEKVKKAMEGQASALHEMSAQLREAQEKYLDKQEEIDRARAQVEELNVSLQNAKESYEVMLDEANYEKVCLKKSVERMQAEAKSASEEWQSKELSFVNSIKKSEEEINNARAQMDKTLDAVKDKESENAELLEKMKHLEAQIMEANKTSEEAKAETLQWKEKLLDKENELQNIKQENDDLQAKELVASDKIKELSSQLANSKDGAMNGSNKEQGNVKGDSEDDEPVMVVAKMWENSKITDDASSKEKGNDGESEVDLESNTGDSIVEGNGLHSRTASNGNVSPTKQQQQHKKKPLLKKFGGLLKKKTQP
ncbi:WEB family protein At5g16730, chloroplastic [Oryza brachyantha]|uniref:WEB family protein At5g16730, chloroplastic n=1 Tax=Oryza brachyantha TaxID=4533 RepID=UPI0003EAB06B|nr:WEB family protein At5g16730, chloroplastic [Oryza brachyantha]